MGDDIYIHIIFKLSTNTLLTNLEMNLIYLSNIKKVKNSDHIILFSYFYNHNKNLCDKFTSL